MKKMIVLNGIDYELVTNYKDGYDDSAVNEKITEYYEAYDYIVGDWSYGKLRMKGFCDKGNKIHTNINDYGLVEDYIKKYCSFECKYFILKKIK